MPTLINGSQIPRLLYGTALRPRNEPQLIETALTAGYGGIDTACSRKLHSEDADGVALRTTLAKANASQRSSLLVQSKFVAAEDQADPWPYRFEDTLRLQVLLSVARSCEDLGVDVLDVYFLARPFPTLNDSIITWKSLEDIVHQGGIRYLGLCNCTVASLRDLYSMVTIKPRFIQINVDDFYGDGGETAEFCRMHDVVVEIFGLFWNQTERLLHLDVVNAWAVEHHQSNQAALLSFVLADASNRGLQIVVVDASRHEVHINNNVMAAHMSLHMPFVHISKFREEMGSVYGISVTTTST